MLQDEGPPRGQGRSGNVVEALQDVLGRSDSAAKEIVARIRAQSLGVGAASVPARITILVQCADQILWPVIMEGDMGLKGKQLMMEWTLLTAVLCS